MSMWSVSKSTSPVSGSVMGTAGKRPWMLVPKDSTTWPLS